MNTLNNIIMKKAALFFIALFFSFVSFSQAKYQPNVVVVFAGEKNTTFDESKFPNCNFYYTPEITVASTKKAKSLFGKALGAMTYERTYTGSPEEFYFTKMEYATFFDKNGVISGLYKSFDNVLTSSKKNLYGTPNFENYNKFSRDFVKKGKTTKKAKKDPRKPTFIFDYYGKQLPKDFNVKDASGNTLSLQSLVSGSNLTLLYVLYLDPKIDLNKGLESGANKKGKEYLKDVYNTTKGINGLGLLENFESEFFGHRVTW